MNDLQVFKNSDFGEIGILLIDGKEYFPATACAKILGYEKPHNAIKRHCRYSLKRGVPHPQSPGKTVQTNFIPEGDLYRLIVHSKLPAAERFEKWVFDEVLPTIRKQGAYVPELAAISKFMEQMATAFTTLTSAVSGILDRLERLEERQQAAPRLRHRTQANTDLYAANRCKLETFPEEITEQVDDMLKDMLRQQALNFSMIARYCTMSGYPISQPAVKRYYMRHFSEE